MTDILNEAEVAEMLGCDSSTIQEKARCGEIPALKFGRSWRFPKAALLDALNIMAAANHTKNRDKAIATTANTEKPRRRKLPQLVDLH